MDKLKAIGGYTLAALAIPLMLFTLAALILPQPGEAFIAATGLKTIAKYTGGEVVQTIDHGAYQTQVHRMVFDALLWERQEGFVQVGWTPPDRLPARIDEEIDANGDGQADFRLEVNPAAKQATLTSYADWVQEIEGTYLLTQELAVRVRLRNPSR